MVMVSSRHSGLDTHSSEQTPFNNHRPTNNVRRQSRLVYAEKYGLNSPEWKNSTTFDTLDKGSNNHQSSATGTGTAVNNYHDDGDKDEDDDDRPLSLQPRSYSYSAAMSSGRPRSIFNLSEPSITATRPTIFVKPITATAAAASGSPPCTVPNDMMIIQQLYERYHNKIYMEGFVFKRNKRSSDGTICQDQWTRLYVELSGPILSLWDGRKLNSTSGSILPKYINISDATVTLVNNDNNNNDSNLATIVLNTAGRNEYLIRPDPPTLFTAQRWIIAIRLSCFECARLFEFYSRQLLLRPTYSHLWNYSSTKQPSTRRRIEGFVQARFAGDTEWKKYWAVVSDQRDQKRLFGKSKSVPCRGQFMFYESKKSKYPLVTLVNIVYAYTLYPQSPRLIDMATMFKVEGTTLTTTDLKTGEQNMTHASAGTLLMAPSTKDMMQWLVGIFDVFKLYGRPSLLLDDSLDPKALNFGETTTTNNDYNQLFLDYRDVMHLSIGQDETLLETKMAFTNVLAQKLTTGSTNPATNSRSNSAPFLSSIATPPSDYTMNQHTHHTRNSTVTRSTSIATISNQSTQPAQRTSMLIRRRSHGVPMVYASDDSDEENDTGNNDSEEDDDNHSDTLSEFIATNGLLNRSYGDKELQASSGSSISSPTASTTDSNKVLSLNDEHQDNDNAADMMGFANDLLSKTFGTDSTNISPTTTPIVPIINTTNLSRSSLKNASGSSSSEYTSPMHAAASRTATVIDSTTSLPTITTACIEKTPFTKRISVPPLPSDCENEDNAESTTEEDDDSPLQICPSSKMIASTSSLSSGRPLSTILSTSTTPTTAASTRFSTTTSSDGSSSNTSNTSTSTQHYRKSKRRSMLSQQQQPAPTPSMGLVHKIDTMQQQIQLQQQQQQLEKEQQSLWETGSLMGTDPRIASYQYRPNQQQQQRQQQQQQQQQQTWDTRSMTSSVTGPDPRIALYRQAGSMYSSSAYGGNGGGGGNGGSVYSTGDDYQKMMMMAPGQPLVQLENKPSEPRSGLVGVISQLEDEEREPENNNRFSTSLSLEQQEQQLIYQQQLFQQQQMMMNNPYYMNQMMMNPMMMNPMMMNPMMMNPMMANPMIANPMMANPMLMMQQQPPPQQQQQQQRRPKSRSSMYHSTSFYNNQQPLMEADNEEDDDTPLARSDAIPGNRRKSYGRF